MRLVIVMICLAGPLAAQEVAGSWQCSTAFAEYDAAGGERVAGTMDYVLAVAEGGQFRAQGSHASSVGSAPFQALGRWTLEGDAFEAQGQASFGTFGQGLFGVAATVSEGRMARTVEVVRPEGGLLSRTATDCTRTD